MFAPCGDRGVQDAQKKDALQSHWSYFGLNLDLIDFGFDQTSLKLNLDDPKILARFDFRHVFLVVAPPRAGHQ